MLLARHVVGLLIAYMLLVVGVSLLFQTEWGAAVTGLVLAAVIVWVSVRAPLRVRKAFHQAQAEELRSRADAGHQAFLRGERGYGALPDAAMTPPVISPGARVAAVICAVVALLFTLGVLFGPGTVTDTDDEAAAAPAAPAVQRAVQGETRAESGPCAPADQPAITRSTGAVSSSGSSRISPR